MKATRDVTAERDESSCGQCGGTYSTAGTFGTDARRMALFACDQCGAKNFVAVAVRDTTPPNVESILASRRDNYPALFTVATVSAHIDASVGTGRYRVFNDSGTICISSPDMTPEKELELYDALQHPRTLVSVEDETVRVQAQQGSIINHGGGTSPGIPNPSGSVAGQHSPTDPVQIPAE